MRKILDYYQSHRASIIMKLLAASVFFSWAKFLWDIEDRNLKVGCLPEATYLACFNLNNLGYTLLGFVMYPLSIGWVYFILLLAPAAFLEIILRFSKSK